MGDETVEQTLIVCREAALYKISPRSSGGHKSGDWLVTDKIFSGRVRVIAKGELAEVRIEDPNSGELFAMCPVAPGQRPLAVEPVTDSSRGFVLRLVDPTSGRHAFIGLMFGDRNDAFDFNVALSDHEKHLQRNKEVAAAREGAADPRNAGGAGAAAPSAEVAALYRHQDLSLKAGETLKIQMKAPAGKAEASGRSGGSFLAQLGSAGGSQAGGTPLPSGGLLASLPPPPPPQPSALATPAAPSGRRAGQGVPAPPATASGGESDDLLGLDAPPTTVAAVAGAAAALEGFKPFGGKSTTTAISTDSWATFE